MALVVTSRRRDVGAPKINDGAKRLLNVMNNTNTWLSIFCIFATSAFSESKSSSGNYEVCFNALVRIVEKQVNEGFEGTPISYAFWKPSILGASGLDEVIINCYQQFIGRPDLGINYLANREIKSVEEQFIKLLLLRQIYFSPLGAFTHPIPRRLANGEVWKNEPYAAIIRRNVAESEERRVLDNERLLEELYKEIDKSVESGVSILVHLGFATLYMIHERTGPVH